MRDISFFSEDKYLYLPSIRNPRVTLAIGSSKTAKNSYKLYNPFSPKAILLKKISKFLLENFNKLSIVLVRSRSHNKSDFIDYLERKLNVKLTVSIYWATDRDKVVLQLQSNNEIYGYLKFPQNEEGIKNIENEKKAILKLSEYFIIPPFILADIYKNIPYILLPELKGRIGNLSDDDVVSLISKFKKKKKFKLIEHQRIKELNNNLEVLNLELYKSIVDVTIKNSSLYYYEAFEHGDFTPWNIIKTEDGLVPFDFELFIENGIEYFDLIKYHFQVGRLLKKLNYKDLSNYIFKKVNIPEIKELLVLFLIKEIIRLNRSRESYQFQANMIKYL